MLRWQNYFLKSGDAFSKFWHDYQNTSDVNILFILGVGFDPRTLQGIRDIYSQKSLQKRDTAVLRYFKNIDAVDDPPPKSVKNHLDQLELFLQEKGHSPLTQHDVILRSGDKSISSISATSIVKDISFFSDYSDIIIDISAMPRGVFIPLINKSLDILDKYNQVNDEKKNLHVIVSENSSLDAIINDRGLDEESTFIHGFHIKEIDRTADQKEVWILILGERQGEQFDKIKAKIAPVEICPVIPFPSENMRRGDNLIVEYQDKLFNSSDFEAKNIVYVDESNPFQVYRLVSQTITRYEQSFALISGCKIVVSALSSKLLTIGTFLAVFEKKKEGVNLGIMHVESLEHDLDPSYDDAKSEIDKQTRMFEIWLAGKPYKS